ARQTAKDFSATRGISRSSGSWSWNHLTTRGSDLERTANAYLEIESLHVDDGAPVVDAACQHRERVVRGAGQRIAELVIEIGGTLDQRVIDGVLRQRQVRDIVAEKRLHVAAFEI